MTFTAFPAHTSTASSMAVEPDWQVLVVLDEESAIEKIKGIWGPYTSVEVASAALDELRQWPLDGRWDVRRLNKFVARKSGSEPDQLVRWSWQ